MDLKFTDSNRVMKHYFFPFFFNIKDNTYTNGTKTNINA